MNIKHLLTIVLCAAVSGKAIAQDQSMDAALSKLADNLAGQIKANGNKKVTVLDFTDLQGNYTELGRYVAEQLTVDLVMGKHQFAVLDRANLKQILAEHKLTAKGLVNPENAKKLGEFAGVDALILGTLVPTKQDVELTAKIITTDTAEIIGADKASFGNSPEVAQLLKNSVAPTGADTGQQEPSAPDFNASKSSFDFGRLNVSLDAFRVLHSGEIVATIQFKNTDARNAIRVALNNPASGEGSSLVDDQGRQYQESRGPEGIAVRRPPGVRWVNPTATAGQLQAQQYDRTRQSMDDATVLRPDETVSATLYFSSRFIGPRDSGSSFDLQCGFTAATTGQSGRENFDEHTLTIQGIRPQLPKSR